MLHGNFVDPDSCDRGRGMICPATCDAEAPRLAEEAICIDQQWTQAVCTQGSCTNNIVDAGETLVDCGGLVQRTRAQHLHQVAAIRRRKSHTYTRTHTTDLLRTSLIAAPQALPAVLGHMCGQCTEW